MYSVRLLPQARRFYADADRPLANKLARCFEQLEENPRIHPNITRLKGPLAGYYRFRVGDYRVIYRIEERGRIVIVAIIAHRREAYE
jgi:mRNA interferase RelE/StbE